MFSEPNPTPFDLVFRIFGISVRISVWFWVLGALIGYPFLKAGVPYLLMWLWIFLISVIFHELGHAFAAKAFGFRPSIYLVQLGGFCRYEPFGSNHTLGNSILISLAGPVAGFFLAGLAYVFLSFVDPYLTPKMSPEAGDMVSLTFSWLLVVNIYLSLVNLLPIYPLDGGHIMRDICLMFKPHSGFWIAIKISIVTAAIACGIAFTFQFTFAAVWAAILCFSNIQILQQRNQYM